MDTFWASSLSLSDPCRESWGFHPKWQGTIAAASLAGMLAGGALFGHVTDLIGRRLMYTLDLLVFVVASLGQIWASSALSLLMLRLVLGVAVGADYPIVSALLAEFAPKRQRGMSLSAMVGAWWVGYTVSFLVGYFLSLSGDSTWHWMLASSAHPRRSSHGYAAGYAGITPLASIERPGERGAGVGAQTLRTRVRARG